MNPESPDQGLLALADWSSNHADDPLPQITMRFEQTGSSFIDMGQDDEYDDTAAGPPVDQSQYAANPLPFISGSDRPFSLRNLLHPASTSRTGTIRGNQDVQGSPRGGDLIARGVLPIEMARHLFFL